MSCQAGRILAQVCSIGCVRRGTCAYKTNNIESINILFFTNQNQHTMQKIVTFLWFDGQAEEAVNFYTSVFKDSKIITIARYPDVVPNMKGKVLTAVFELNGQRFMALDGGPQFKFSEAISLFINCDNQQEIDYFWEKLTAGGGQESRCGWLKDKFGLSWQVVPANMGELMQPKDPAKGGRAVQALMQMSKISIKILEEA